MRTGPARSAPARLGDGRRTDVAGRTVRHAPRSGRGQRGAGGAAPVTLHPPPVVTSFPRPVREIENLWIPLADGTRLAARIWLPQDAERDPVPAVLEFLPYRKNDGTVVRDAVRQPYLAGHGYAAVRIDARGTGESDGIIEDEYTPQELADGVEV